MDFIAIDFETANQKYFSPCQVGIAVVEDFQITHEISTFIYVNPDKFIGIELLDDKLFGNKQYQVHKIKEFMVKDSPEFDEIYKLKLKDLINRFPIISHNTNFDIGVLQQTLNLYDINLPQQKFVCTQKISKNLHSKFSFENNKLNTVYKAIIGKPLPNHHDAKYDARGCAEIAIKLFKDFSVTNFNQITEVFNVPVGDISIVNSSSKSNSKKSKPANTNTLTYLNADYIAPLGFNGCSIVPTGVFYLVSRKIIEALILKITDKKKVVTSISKSTKFIVAGTNMGPSKKAKAEELGVLILTEKEFLELVKYTDFID